MGSGQQCVATTASWREFATLQYTALRGGSELELYAYQTASAVAGESFELDGMSLSDGSPAAVPETPAASGDPVLLAAGDVASCWSSGDESVSRLLDTLPGTVVDPRRHRAEPRLCGRVRGLLRPELGPPQGAHQVRRGRSRVQPGRGRRVLRLLRLRNGRARQGLVQLRPRRLAHRRPQQQLRRSWAAAGPAPSSTSGSSRTCSEHAGSCVGAYWHHPRFSAGGMHGEQAERAAVLGSPLPVRGGVGARRQRPQLPAVRTPDPDRRAGPRPRHAAVRGGRGRHACTTRSAPRFRTPRSRTRAPSGC